MASEFDIEVSSTSSDAAHIAIFVNPKQIVQEKFTLYSDMWPVAWKVFHMPPMSGAGDSPSVASHHYDPELRAYIAEEDIDNTITAADARDITEENNTFQIVLEGTVPSITYDKTFTSPNTAAIVNRTKKTRKAGVADKNNNPYITLKVQQDFTAEFKGEFEFAVCVVTNMTKGTQFEGQSVGPWVSFTANAIKGDISILFNGSKLTIGGVNYTTHASTERVFTQKA